MKLIWNCRAKALAPISVSPAIRTVPSTFLSSLFLSVVFIKLVRCLDRNCPGGKLPIPVHVLGEELTACGVIPDLSRKISVIRSRNISMSCVFQNLAGLQNRYPLNQWQEILGNSDVQLFLGCVDELYSNISATVRRVCPCMCRARRSSSAHGASQLHRNIARPAVSASESC